MPRSPSLNRHCWLLALGTACACTRAPKQRHALPTAVSAVASHGVPESARELSDSSRESDRDGSLDGVATSAPAVSCPTGMSFLPGGSFWMGSEPAEHYADDESPRFRTTLAPFCLDRTEVTVDAYAACVTRRACTAAAASHGQCNAAHRDRGNYPINCVTWSQANAFCAERGQRLPSEPEWEFAARGGEQYLKYPWGDASPDGHACWKHGGGSCAIRAYPAGAFDLYDISGNVWEWTDDWYAAYPWPPATGFAKVYRGGGWSRRFEKWMHTRLRNRANPHDQGAHLGFRCALVPDLSRCAAGRFDDQRCLPSVNEQTCSDPATAWNGVRCAKPNAPHCPVGRTEQPGRGCVASEPEVPKGVDLDREQARVQRAAAPEFSRDCQTNFAPLVHAFRYFGGTHAARNLVSHRAGCKNRDVGVGWNSTCCP